MADLYAIAGGKGGVGKSVSSIMLAKSFALSGQKTILVDGDLGGSNLHTLLGMQFPRYGLVDFVLRNSHTLSEVQTKTTDENINLISGAGEVLGMANLKWATKHKLIRHLKKLETDKVIIDLGAGTNFSVLDIFLYTGRHILVLTPEPTSLQNANEFIKFCVARLLYLNFSKNELMKKFLDRFVVPNKRNAISTLGELLNKVSSKNKGLGAEIKDVLARFKPYIIINMANNQQEAVKYYKAVETMARQYLKIKVRLLTVIEKDATVTGAIRKNKSLLSLSYGDNQKAIADIQQTLCNGRLRKNASSV